MPLDQPNLNERNKGGSEVVIRDLPYKLPNINWDNTFWRATNNSGTMHTLGIRREDRAQEIAVFWVTGLNQYASLKYGTYGSWNIKVDCDANVMTEIQGFLQTSGILGKNWKKGGDNTLSMLSKKNHINDQIDLMDDGDETEWMERLCSKRTFPFTYNGIADINPNPGHDIDQFWPGRNVVAEFSSHAINFKSTAKPDGTFNYNFRF